MNLIGNLFLGALIGIFYGQFCSLRAWRRLESTHSCWMIGIIGALLGSHFFEILGYLDVPAQYKTLAAIFGAFLLSAMVNALQKKRHLTI